MMCPYTCPNNNFLMETWSYNLKDEKQMEKCNVI